MICKFSTFTFEYISMKKIIGVRGGGGGQGGAAAPPKRLQSRKVEQMFNISRAKSGKLKIQKAKKPPVCWANKGSRAIFASQSGNIRFTVGQYWLIIKRTGTNNVNFVVNLVMGTIRKGRANFFPPPFPYAHEENHEEKLYFLLDK